MRESRVEERLRLGVKRAGGLRLKFRSPGRSNVPDDIVIWPRFAALPDIHFVECKAPRKGARAGQAREHERLRKLGCHVFLLDTVDKVDVYILDFKP